MQRNAIGDVRTKNNNDNTGGGGEFNGGFHVGFLKKQETIEFYGKGRNGLAKDNKKEFVFALTFTFTLSCSHFRPLPATPLGSRKKRALPSARIPKPK